MRLSEFLNYFDFDYKIVDGQMRFVDLQGANLGGIEEERWCLEKGLFAGVVDRMDIYINDYVLHDLEEQLSTAGVKDVWKLNLADMVKEADKLDFWYDEKIIGAILNPSVLELDKEKLIESFSVGQVFFEKDTEKYIVLDKLVDDTVNKDIWSFKVYDKNMQYLYDTTALDVRLAQDIIGGYIQSVTHEKVLRIEPDCLLEWKGELSATLEDNDKLWNRFGDCCKTEDGELKYVTVDYNPVVSSMVFKLHCEKVDKNNLDVFRNVIDVVAEPEEKEMLLKEMKAFIPEFFERFEKPSLDTVINNCEKVNKKADVVDINNYMEER